MRSWIGHLGTKSFTIRAQVCDGELLLADAAVVMVTFDKETQRPAPMADTQREPARGRGARLERFHGVHHELRRVGHVVPELRVLLGRQVGLVERGAEVQEPVVLRRPA